MRVWTKSACVMLAWSVLAILAVAGLKGPGRPAQAGIRIASSTHVTLASVVSISAARLTATRPAAKYAVQPGDTLSGIAARFAVPGGWQALYAANRRVIGPDPDVINPGTVLVLPGLMAQVRYTVAAGDTLSGIAARFAVPGGWQALYAANRRVIGPDPDLIHPGVVLTIRRVAAQSPPAPSPGRRQRPSPRPAPAGRGHQPRPSRTGTRSGGVPQWLEVMLLTVLVIGTSLLADRVVRVICRRRRQSAVQAAVPAERARKPALAPAQREGQGSGCGWLIAGKPRIVVADHDRLVVTWDGRDGTVYVLRRPGEDPRTVLRAARLVLPEDPYRELAGQLGMPASWPVIVADHDRLVVTWDGRDGTAYVLRRPGEDPRTVLRAARLVLPEDPYGELAGMLGLPAGWPTEGSWPGRGGLAEHPRPAGDLYGPGGCRWLAGGSGEALFRSDSTSAAT